MAVNCLVEASTMLDPVGSTSIANSVADVTVSTVLPETPAAVAVIVAAPVLRDVARPADPAALLMAATVVSDEPQVTDAVMFLVEWSE